VLRRWGHEMLLWCWASTPAAPENHQARADEMRALWEEHYDTAADRDGGVGLRPEGMREN
jgi:hypothetical protein